jgi:hypothetical protein
LFNKRPLGRPRSRWEDNNKLNLQEVGFGDVDWIELAQDRDRWPALVNAVMKSLGGSSPLCAITISQLIRWVSQNKQNFIKIQESKDRQHVSALFQ